MHLNLSTVVVPVDRLRILPADDDGRLPRLKAVNFFSAWVEYLDWAFQARMAARVSGDTPDATPPLAARQPKAA